MADIFGEEWELFERTAMVQLEVKEVPEEALPAMTAQEEGTAKSLILHRCHCRHPKLVLTYSHDLLHQTLVFVLPRMSHHSICSFFVYFLHDRALVLLSARVESFLVPQ